MTGLLQIVLLSALIVACAADNESDNEYLVCKKVEEIFASGEKGPPGEKGEVGAPGPPGIVDHTIGNKGINEVKDDLEMKFEILNQKFEELKKNLTSHTEEHLGLVGDGWHMIEHNSYHYWFKVFTDKANYQNAKLRCTQAGALLASKGLRISDILTEVVTRLVRPLRQSIWIGLDDLESQNTWMWADGVLSTRSNTDWGRNEPSSANERCADFYIGVDYHINDAPCSLSYSYLCEKVLRRP